jgi:hypothetical protein
MGHRRVSNNGIFKKIAVYHFFANLNPSALNEDFSVGNLIIVAFQEIHRNCIKHSHKYIFSTLKLQEENTYFKN